MKKLTLSFLCLVLIAGFCLSSARAQDAAPTYVPAKSSWHYTWDIGPEVFYYHYTEPHFANLYGAMYGIQGDFAAIKKHWYLGLDAHAGGGWLTYSSQPTGRINNNLNSYIEPRALVGWIMGNHNTFTPYTGFGFRFLKDEQQGHTKLVGNELFEGYNRFSHYYYLPLGVAFGFDLGSGFHFAPNFEYDYFIAGEQQTQTTGLVTTYLGQNFTGVTDLHNAQHNGYGLRASLPVSKQFEYGNLIFTPFVRYWNIRESDSNTYLAVNASHTLGLITTGVEPANHTIELGAALTWQF